MKGVRYTIDDISDALIKCDGVITAAAKELGMARSALSERISSEPELKPLLEALRGNYQDKRLDVSENLLDKYLHQYEKYPRLAFQSATYILDNHGKKRGYNRSKEEEVEQNNADLAKDFKLFMEFLKFQQSSLNQADNSNNNEQKS